MALPLIKNMVGMTVTGTPGTGTITLNAAYADATTTYRSFATAYGANAVTDIAIFEDSVGWELARGCTYTHSGTTIGQHRQMSGFNSDLRMTALRSSDGVPLQSAIGNQLYMLDAPLYYQSDLVDYEFMVPEGFVTDLSSIPKLPFIYLLLNGISDMPAVIHDYLYSTSIVARKMADAILREACLVIGVPRWKVEAIYAGVRVGGFDHYARNALVNGSSLN